MMVVVSVDRDAAVVRLTAAEVAMLATALGQSLTTGTSLELQPDTLGDTEPARRLLHELAELEGDHLLTQPRLP